MPLPPLDDIVVHRMVDVGEVRLHVAEVGHEGPLVVLLHGFPEFWYSWRHQIPALAAAGYRVVAPDLRGYHRSDRPRGRAAYRAQSLVADVAGLVAAYGEERAAVVGHDWGGFVAWITALTRPDVVERLVICNAPHPALFSRALRRPDQWVRSSYVAFFQLPVLPELLLGLGRGAGVRRLLSAVAVGSSNFDEQDLARYADAFQDPAALRGPLAYYRSSGRRVAAEALAGLVRRPARGGPRRERRPITAPTLVLWGMQDPVLPAALADPGGELVPDRKVVLIEGAGHFVQSDAPDRVNDALLAFLAEKR